jgi:endonuclease-3
MLATGPGSVNARPRGDATDDATRDKALEIHRRMSAAYPVADELPRMEPVDELVCTILSQNTTDTARDRAYTSLREAHPDWEAVRDAPVSEIEDLIRVCGLANQKAPRIKRALQAATDASDGTLSLEFLREMEPGEARAWLTGIKGVGIKTASIVMLFALGMPAMPVDTHVHRLSRRLGLIPDNMSAAKAHLELEELLPVELYYPFHVELIRHGRAVCRARKPRCVECPLTDLCEYWSAG